MAKIKVEMICKDCGDIYTVSKEFGNRADANNFENYLRGQNGQCPKCYHADQAKKRSETNNKIIGSSRLSDIELPRLSGSEKQIEWATSIRNEVLSKVAKLIDSDKAETAEGKEVLEKIKGMFAAIKDAKTYIDNRHLDGIDFTNKFVKR